MRRLLAVAALTGGALLAVAAPAAAHPLGNFTVNTADAVVVVDGGVEVTHVVDSAEIPSVQLRGTWDADDDGRLAGPELQALADATCAADLPLLGLDVDGAPAALALRSATAAQVPGEAGLPTTRVSCLAAADTAPSSEVSFVDGSSASRNGWREVSATTRCGEVLSSDVSADSPSALLTSYPEGVAPLDVRSAAFTVDPGGCSGGTAAQLVPEGLGGLAGSVTGFLSRPGLTVPFALLSLLVAVVFGAVHAMAPGHGKTVLAAYLVGQRGTRRQALQLGAVVTFTHTASVLLLGAVVALGSLAAPERVLPVLEVVSGVLLALVGAYLLVLALRRRRAGNDHGHGGHEHDHDHDGHHGHGDHGHDRAHHDAHDHDHPHHDHPHPHPHHDHPHHDHGPADHPRPVVVPVQGSDPLQPAPAVSGAPGGVAVAARPAVHVHSHGGRAHSHDIPTGPLTWRSLAAMGVAGGLVPSPSALLVLLGSVYLGRAWWGVVLVLAYGLGMAVTLTVAGLLLLRAQAALDRRGWALGRDGRWGRLLPLAAAGVVVVLGLVLVGRGALTAASLG